MSIRNTLVLRLVLVLVTAALGIGVPAASGSRAQTVTPPFTQCPPVNISHGCALLIVFTESGTALYSDPSAGTFDHPGGDDIVVGVVNDSTATLGGIELQSTEPIFGFDADGLCVFIDCTWPHNTGYEGPNTTFATISGFHGYVNFPSGLAPKTSTYFALEEGLLTHASARPVFAKAAAVDSTIGDVCYYRAGAKVGTDRCIPIATETPVTPGVIIDASKGRAKLRTAEGVGTASGGRFKLTELRVPNAAGSTTRVTELSPVLRPGACATGYRTTSGVSSPPKPKPAERLFVKAKGHYRTRGRYSSGTVRGTSWLVEELCDGTRTTVFEGVVSVRDFALGKTVRVTAGHSYFARKPT